MTTQPHDKNDPVYSAITEFINRGDQKVWAIDLGVSPKTVCQVINGHRRSKKIWSHMIKEVIKRKQQKTEFLKYMQS
jgi:DNA-binding transcriptional regulator YdaS (Cro superfamily)